VQCSRPDCKAFADVTHIKSPSLIRLHEVLSPAVHRYQCMELLIVRDYLGNSDSVHGLTSSKGYVRLRAAGFVRQADWVAFDRWVELEGAFGVLEDQISQCLSSRQASREKSGLRGCSEFELVVDAIAQ